MQNKHQHGGKRPGAGRPPIETPRVRKNVSLHPNFWAILKAEYGTYQGGIEAAVNALLDYRAQKQAGSPTPDEEGPDRSRS